jgi:hypothetical protein
MYEDHKTTITGSGDLRIYDESNEEEPEGSWKTVDMHFKTFKNWRDQEKITEIIRKRIIRIKCNLSLSCIASSVTMTDNR